VGRPVYTKFLTTNLSRKRKMCRLVD
jgi:hypothetical protein